MKKIFVLGLLLFSFAAADELIIQQSILNANNKPTDEEIRATIEKYDFDKKQKEVLFKQMKKQIDEMYDDKKDNCPEMPYIEPDGGLIENYLKDLKPPRE